jgi:hypothetical protein
MQPQTRTRRQGVYLVLFCLAFAVGMAALHSRLKAPPEAWMRNLTNNPDKFFLWGTSTNVNHLFNYDPRAADEWRFETGSWLAAPPPAAAPVFLDLKQGR